LIEKEKEKEKEKEYFSQILRALSTGWSFDWELRMTEEGKLSSSRGSPG